MTTEEPITFYCFTPSEEHDHVWSGPGRIIVTQGETVVGHGDRHVRVCECGAWQFEGDDTPETVGTLHVRIPHGIE